MAEFTSTFEKQEKANKLRISFLLYLSNNISFIKSDSPYYIVLKEKGENTVKQFIHIMILRLFR